MDLGQTSSGYGVAKDLDRLIDSRHRKRVAEEGERPSEAAYAAQERAQRVAMRAENQKAWIEWHENKLLGAYSAIDYHERELRRIKSLVPNGDPPRLGGIYTHSRGFYGGAS